MIARDRMLGVPGEFRYAECAACGCLFLADPPASLDAYYPASYYAFAPRRPRARAREALRTLRLRVAYLGDGAVGGLLRRNMPAPLRFARSWFAHTAAGTDARILDVGCGSGDLVRDLARVGFRHVVGIDPYLADAAPTPPHGARLVRGTVDQLAGEFDLVMFHHSLEHAPDHASVLRHVARLLRPGGWCLVRTPTVPCLAWERYRDRWVQLDAPRHLVIHSPRSMRMMAERAGLVLERVEYDSTEFQFVGSELYRRDRSLRDGLAAFTRRQRRGFAQQAAALNARSQGDQAAFFLRKPTRTAPPSR